MSSENIHRYNYIDDSNLQFYGIGKIILTYINSEKDELNCWKYYLKILQYFNKFKITLRVFGRFAESAGILFFLIYIIQIQLNFAFTKKYIYFGFWFFNFLLIGLRVHLVVGCNPYHGIIMDICFIFLIYGFIIYILLDIE